MQCLMALGLGTLCRPEYLMHAYMFLLFRARTSLTEGQSPACPSQDRPSHIFDTAAEQTSIDFLYSERQ